MRLRDRARDFEDAGVEIVVAFEGSKDDAQRGAQRFRLPFPVVVDDGRLMAATGVKDAGHGPGGTDVFFASSYLVDRDGVVRFAFIGSSVRSRAEPDDVLAAARGIP